MKPCRVVIFCTLILVLASCRHHYHWPNEGRVKTICHHGDTMTCYYYNNGQLAYYATPQGYKTGYEYKGSTLSRDLKITRSPIVTETTTGGSKVTMYLNSKGLVDSLIDIDTMRALVDRAAKKGVQPVRTFPYAGVHVLSYLDGGIAGRDAAVITKKFVYDTAGYLIHQTEYVNGVLWAEASSKIEHGNIVSYAIKYFFTDTVITINPVTMEADTKTMKLADRLFTYRFDAEKKNSLAMTGIFGKCSQNLAVRMTDHAVPLSSGDSTVETYQYSYDDKDRVSTLIKMADGKSDTTVFTYY